MAALAARPRLTRPARADREALFRRWNRADGDRFLAEPEAEGAALGRQLSHSIVQAVSTTIYAHRSILRKAWGGWDEDVDGARQTRTRRCLPVGGMVHR